MDISKILPVVMAFATLHAEIGDLEANAIGVSKKSCPIVRRIVRVMLCFRCFDANLTKPGGYSHHIICQVYPEAKVVESRRISVVYGGATRGAKDIPEVTIEILNVGITTE